MSASAPATTPPLRAPNASQELSRLRWDGLLSIRDVYSLYNSARGARRHERARTSQ